jgi:hypothetical protein
VILARAAVSLGVLGLAGACYIADPGSGGRERDLESARERWGEAGPQAYRTVVTRRSFCGGPLGPVVVTVTGGGVSKVYQEAPAGPVPADEARWYPTVEEAFDLIQDAFDDDAYRVDVRYDPDSGAPLDIFIDRIERAVDEEIRYELTPPEALPAG